MLRFAGFFGEEPTRLDPLVAENISLPELEVTQLTQNIHDLLRKLECALGLLRFCGISVSSPVGGVARGTPDADKTVCKIHIPPFQTKQFAPAAAGVNEQEEERPVLDGLFP